MDVFIISMDVFVVSFFISLGVETCTGPGNLRFYWRWVEHGSVVRAD